MKFTTTRYPSLKVGLGPGYAAFADGVLESDDPAVIKAVTALGPEYGITATGEPPVSVPAEPPAQSATKEQWVAHAVAAHGLDEAEAAKMTKAELIELTEVEDEQ